MNAHLKSTCSRDRFAPHHAGLTSPGEMRAASVESGEHRNFSNLLAVFHVPVLTDKDD